MTRALTFPGQGSQAIGMGQALAQAFPAARQLFEEVDEALKQRTSPQWWHYTGIAASAFAFDLVDATVTMTAGVPQARNRNSVSSQSPIVVSR